MNSTIHLVALCGSLRKDSFNGLLLQNALKLLPEGVTMEIVSFTDLPPYNQDEDTPARSERPQPVTAFRDKLAKADGFVIASPEYNYSIPGALKNAIDWASRGKDSPLLQKPVALIGATTSLWGTVRMQLAFQPIFLTLSMKPALKPEVLVSDAAKKFDDKGYLTDEMARDLLSQKIEALKQLIIQSR